MGHCDLLTAVSPHFVSFAWRYLGAPAIRPRWPQVLRPTDHPGVCCAGCSRSGHSSRNGQDLPSSQGTLVTMRPALRPRRDRVRGMGPVVNGPGEAPAPKQNGGSPRWQISGLNHTAFGLAVYASQWRSPATTPDSLPVTGPQQPGGIRTRRVPTKGFRMVRFFLLS